MESPGLNFDLMDQLTFYGSYHRRPGNQAIHFFFVPLIHWTITVWLAYAPMPTAYDLPAHLDLLPEWLSRYVCTACCFGVTTTAVRPSCVCMKLIQKTDIALRKCVRALWRC